jgi:peroxiredoxin
MISEHTTPTTLADQIAAFNAALASQAPAEVLALFGGEIAALVHSGSAASGLQAGAFAPDFTLPNVDGRPITLSTLLAQGPVVLTFYRGDWCPYCNLQLRAYQAILPQIRDLGARLVAISPQTPDNSLSTAEKKGLTFPVLSDAGNAVARRYGLVFSLSETLRATGAHAPLPSYNGDEAWELPMPGTFVIAPDGTVCLAFVDADWTRRLEPAAILDVLRQLANQSVTIAVRRHWHQSWPIDRSPSRNTSMAE